MSGQTYLPAEMRGEFHRCVADYAALSQALFFVCKDPRRKHRFICRPILMKAKPLSPV